MKKNKRLNYLLIVLVIGIWGTIIYRVLNYSGSDDIPIHASQFNLPPLVQAESTTPSYNLQGGYADPFLNNSPKKKSNSGSRVSSSSKKKDSKTKSATYPSTPPPKPPSILYKGFSVNNNEVSRVKLQIDGKTYTLEIGETVQGVTVQEMSRHRVIVKWNGEQIQVERG